LTQSSSFVMEGVESFSCPTDIVSRCLIFNARKLSLISAGNLSGKNEVTGSSTVSLSSVLAKPIAVEVKLLLKEYSMWLSSA